MDPINYMSLANGAIEDLDNNDFTTIENKVNQYGSLFLSSLINESLATKDNVLVCNRVLKCLKFDNGNLRPFEDKHFQEVNNMFPPTIHQYFLERAFNQGNLACAKMLIKHNAKTDFKARLSEDFGRNKYVQKLNKFIADAKLSNLNDNIGLMLAGKQDINSTLHKMPKDIMDIISLNIFLV